MTATNNYVNASPAAVQLEIASGMPFYQAVLVDSTNFAGATWSLCTCTNLSVDLGLSRRLARRVGWAERFFHQLIPSLGMEAAQAGPHPAAIGALQPGRRAWSRSRSIQLVGSCPEALGTIWYDLSNADRLLPNQDVLILDQYYDTNTWEFTTNTFQAFDVGLAGGTNLITLHAADLAGNQTVTNFTFILDYSSKTNPPAIQLDWPQDGAQIGAGSFTLRGSTDDPTATVRAQVAGTNGNPHTFFGLVERTGKFWVDNIPLAGGTNVVALTITDCRGQQQQHKYQRCPERLAADDEPGHARLPVVAADGQRERDDLRPELRGVGQWGKGEQSRRRHLDGEQRSCHPGWHGGFPDDGLLAR